MPTMDQVAWATCNVTSGDEYKQFKRGDLLPEAVTPEEAAERSILRNGGAIRTVEVVYTAEEVAEMARQRGEATAARESALDTDPSRPLGAQMPGQVPPGMPTMVEPSGSPVVIGDEDLRAEHEQQRAEAEQARERQAREAPPSGNAPKAAWVDHAVNVHGADRAQAEQMTRDQLAARYRQAPEAQDRPQPGAAPPADAPDQEWVDYAVSCGADPAQAAAAPRDHLIAAYGPPGG